MNEPPREYVYALIELYPGGKVLVLGMYSTQELDCRQSKFSVRVVACK